MPWFCSRVAVAEGSSVVDGRVVSNGWKADAHVRQKSHERDESTWDRDGWIWTEDRWGWRVLTQGVQVPESVSPVSLLYWTVIATERRLELEGGTLRMEGPHQGVHWVSGSSVQLYWTVIATEDWVHLRRLVLKGVTLTMKGLHQGVSQLPASVGPVSLLYWTVIATKERVLLRQRPGPGCKEWRSVRWIFTREDKLPMWVQRPALLNTDCPVLLRPLLPHRLGHSEQRLRSSAQFEMFTTSDASQCKLWKVMSNYTPFLERQLIFLHNVLRACRPQFGHCEETRTKNIRTAPELVTGLFQRSRP